MTLLLSPLFFSSHVLIVGSVSQDGSARRNARSPTRFIVGPGDLPLSLQDTAPVQRAKTTRELEDEEGSGDLSASLSHHSWWKRRVRLLTVFHCSTQG